MTAKPPGTTLVREVVALFSSMQSFRRELASIRHPSQLEDRFDTVSEQLDAIVQATEDATNAILGAVEAIDEAIGGQREKLAAAGLEDWAGDVESRIQAIFEACTFQDITGQRIGKIVNELKFIDDKLNAMIKIWGPEGLKEEPIAAADVPEGELLDGPALKGRGVSQDEIDKLFD